jgi:hypothetical protein
MLAEKCKYQWELDIYVPEDKKNTIYYEVSKMKLFYLLHAFLGKLYIVCSCVFYLNVVFI